MQQLEGRNTYTPTDASQVRGNCDLQLNKEETLSVASLKTSSNNLEVNLSQRHTGKLNVMVYVRSIDGKPLMPCKPAKAKKLLKSGKARVVKFKPFTIQLNFECENQVQEVSLGIDAGYIHIGFSAIDSKRELVSGILELDCKTSERLNDRKMYRKLKRNRLWYRKLRFLNRKKRDGWLPPSIQRRYDTHLRLIKLYQSILPITSITIETAKFDIQKIMNPEISGVEYQQGNMYEYQNIRSYLLAREKGLCQLCKKKFDKNSPSHMHHCKQRKDSGSDRVENLAILHKKCHEELHKKGLKLSIPREFKAENFMSIIHSRFIKDIIDIKIVFGYKTFVDRNNLGLEKIHYNDAFVIAGGTNQIRCKSITIKQKHRNNRKLQIQRNGFKLSIRRQRYKIQPRDLVWVENKQYITKGIRNYGTIVIIEGRTKEFGIKKIKKTYHFGSLAFN